MITNFKIFKEAFEEELDTAITPDDAKFKVGDNVRVVRAYDESDYNYDDSFKWDDTIYKLQRYYIKYNPDDDYECEILDYRDNGFYIVHESQLDFVPEHEVNAIKYNL